jgi:ADP-L-glycero-D-manno-heptose 6-epimerase
MGRTPRFLGSRSLTIIVTGGAGFIGSNIVAGLAENGARVVVVDWLEDGDKWKNLARHFVHDLIRPDAFYPWLAREHASIKAVVHMGAISATTERDGDKLVRENIRLTLDLWEWCARSEKPFIYASSAATYGDGSSGFDDDWSEAGLAKLVPLNGYGWSKHFVDRRISHDVANGCAQPPKWAGLKFFNVYGPNEYHKGPMRSVVHQIYPGVVRGEAVPLFKSHRPEYSDGGQFRDFIYVKDCVAVVEWMLSHPFPSGIYNIGTGEARTWLDLATAVFAAAGRDANIEFIDTPIEIRDRYQYFTQANMQRLRTSGCGVKFHTLEDGIRDYVSGFLSKDNPFA